MKTFTTAILRTFFSFVTLCVPILSYAQLEIKSEVGRPSASVNDFTKYGKFDPQLYSGKVSVSVPIYTLSDEDFTIPISLDYSYNGFVPNSQASEVGLGWTLSAGGFITREVRGLADEGFTSIYIQSGLSRDLYGFDFLSPEEKCGYMNADVRYQYLEDDTSPETILRTYIFGSDGKYYDGTPDIYHFTFLGRSGSFIIDNETGKFKAYNTSTFDGDYKIEKITYYDSEHGFLYPSSFTITTSDGYHYVFGDASAGSYETYTERNTLIRSSSPSEEQIRLFNYPAIAWALRKIVAPNGREVLFRYNGGHDDSGNNSLPDGKNGILEFSYTVYSMSPSLWGGGISYSGLWSAQSNLQPHEQLNSKCLLTSIESDFFELRFHYEDKLPSQISLYNKSGIATRLTSGYVPVLTGITDLSGSSLASLEYVYNHRGNPYPFLSKVTLPGHGAYSFDYQDIQTRYLPPMGTIATDHWGYLRSTDSSTCNIFTFNSSHVGIQTSDYNETPPSLRNPSFNASSVGLMTKICYPTGGYSTFEWEPNQYRTSLQKTSANSFLPTLSALSQSHEGPGGRISKIVNYDTDGTRIDSTRYNYVAANGLESGVLLRTPRYSISYDGLLGGNYYSFYYVTTGGISSFDAVPVEYPRVEEVLSDSSKVVHTFSNYSTHPDLFTSSRYAMIRHRGDGLNSYVNATSVNVYNSTVVSNILRPTSSRQHLRGKLLEQTILDASSDTVKRSVSTYMTTGASHPHNVYVGEAFSDVGIQSGGCLLLRSAVTDYLDDAATVSSSQELGYNDIGQTTQVQQTLSNGDVLTTIYRYASDMISEPLGNTIYHKMISDNVIGYPIEIERRVHRSGDNASSLLSKERYTFERFTAQYDTSLHYYKPVMIERYDTKTESYYTFATLEYDSSTGYLAKKTDGNGSITLYSWSSLGVTQITENAQEPLENRQVWSFTYYKHNLPSTLTDPSGRTVYYTYDSSDRLISTTNSKGEKVEEYYYNTITK